MNEGEKRERRRRVLICGVCDVCDRRIQKKGTVWRGSENIWNSVPVLFFLTDDALPLLLGEILGRSVPNARLQYRKDRVIWKRKTHQTISNWSNRDVYRGDGFLRASVSIVVLQRATRKYVKEVRLHYDLPNPTWSYSLSLSRSFPLHSIYVQCVCIFFVSRGVKHW